MKNESREIQLIDIPSVDSFETNLKSLSTPKELSLKSCQGLEDIQLAKGSLVEVDKSIADYNNGYDRDADSFTSDAKSRYIKADKIYYSQTKKNMSIHSGKRTVNRQAELYIKYKWHGQGNPASWPGCSFHNWGLAADMIRTDEANIKAALNANGWAQTVADEGWHFECTGSSDYAKAGKKIKSFRKSGTGLAYKWSEQVAYFYLKSRDFNKRAPVFNKRLESHRSTGQILQNDINSYNSDISKLKARIASYNSDVNHFNNELRRAERLYNEIMNMPSGPDRNRKIREYNKLVSWLKQESNRLDTDSRSIDQENNRLSKISAALDVRIRAFKKEDEWLNKEYKELTKIESEIPMHQAKANEFLGKIDSAVA